MKKFLNPANGQVVSFGDNVPVPPNYVEVVDAPCGNCSFPVKASLITPVDEVSEKSEDTLVDDTLVELDSDPQPQGIGDKPSKKGKK
jgi:hypothetical protein